MPSVTGARLRFIPQRTEVDCAVAVCATLAGVTYREALAAVLKRRTGLGRPPKRSLRVGGEGGQRRTTARPPTSQI
jgi:hypothetical protein